MTTTSVAPVLLAPASGPGVGGGHVLRCLSLATSLRRKGSTCSFLVGPHGEGLISRFADPGVTVHLDADEALASLESRPHVVVDDYSRSAELERLFRPYARRILAIDDLADRVHDADIIVDPGFGRVAADYAGLAHSGVLFLLGPDYALVRPEFAAARSLCLARTTPPSPSRVFVSFGLSDVGGVAARAVKLILAFDANVRVDLALASDAQSLPAVEAMARIERRLTVHRDASNIADLLASCDLAVGAGGSSTWERMCLGRASLAVCVADNQRPLLRALEAENALIAVDLDDPDFDQVFANALRSLWAQETRQSLQEKSAAFCDGKGADRVADALLAP